MISEMKYFLVFLNGFLDLIKTLNDVLVASFPSFGFNDAVKSKAFKLEMCVCFLFDPGLKITCEFVPRKGFSKYFLFGVRMYIPNLKYLHL